MLRFDVVRRCIWLLEIPIPDILHRKMLDHGILGVQGTATRDA
ncbi:hypothetical protein [Novosphingobium sediminicola]|uniref:Uncharacterized protein n=1 Tax=Novosphingobium sediminicola TaxID=563162 RepID=A0A7W6G7P4_9SPHN|nr:hypothetical protein [Novosphingobium sediminicola]MBB3957114.1 hypothetical protein [Novosphingobium sediminicola]